MSGHLYFNELHAGAAARKTKVWEVTATASDNILGRVKFYGQWRKYVFFPYDETLFDASCLREIAEFSESETKKWRESLKEIKREAGIASMSAWIRSIVLEKLNGKKGQK